MKVRLLADADLNRAIVSGLLRKEPSIDFLSAQAAGIRSVNVATAIQELHFIWLASDASDWVGRLIWLPL
ncbi:MAG: hypothetical protein JST93_24910 [Acidobacteria bacterium]|nr:hypothetical protein [Acidobacteriota bacterium]